MNDFKIKKVRRKNVSNVRIFSKESQLVKDENKKRQSLKRIVKKPQVVQQQSLTELKNIIYKKNVQQIESMFFRNSISYSQYKVAKKITSKKHKTNSLFKTSYSTILKDIRDFNMIKLQTIINA